MRPVQIDIIGRDRFSPAAQRAGASATTLAGRLNSLNKRAAVVGKQMTHSLTLPLVAIAAVSVKMATDFNSAMTKVQTQAGASAKDVKTLSTQVLNLAKYAEQGPTELANSLYHLKSVGMDNVSAMKALKQASDLASVGGASLEETTNSLAGAWRTGIKGATNFHQAVATVNAIIGAGNMRMEDFNAALGTGILPTAKTFGLTLKDVGAALALFTDEGVPADAAATRLRMSMSLLGAPSAVAEKQLNKIGLTGLKLAEDMRKPNGLIVAIGDLKSHIEDPKFGLSLSKQAQLLSHAFGGGRSSSAILSLINNYDVLVKKQAQVTKSMGKYDEAVAAQRATPEAQFKLLASSLQRAAIIIGDDLLPYVVKLAQKIGAAAEWFNNLSASTRKWILITAGIVAALGPVITILTRLYIVGRLVVLTFLKFGAAAVAVVRFTKGLLLANVALKTYETTSFSAGVATRGFLSNITPATLGLVAAVAVIGVAGAKLSGWIEKNRSGVKVIYALKGAVDSWTQSLVANNGALDATTRTSVAMQLQQTGIADKANKAHINLTELTDGITGTDAQFNALIATWKASGKPANDTIQAAGMLHYGYTQAATAASKLVAVNQTQVRTNLRVATGTKTLAQGLRNTYAEQVPKAAQATDAFSAAADHSVAATGRLGTVLKQTALSGQKLADALNSVDGGAIATATAQIALAQAGKGLKDAFDKNNKSIEGNSAAALQNRSAVLSALGTAKDHAAALASQGKGAKAVALALENDVRGLRAADVAAGGSGRQFDTLARKMGLVPKRIEPKVLTDTQAAELALARLQRALNSIVNHTYVAHVTASGQVNVSGTTPGGGHYSGHAARGTIVRGPGGPTSDKAGIYALSNGEAVIPAKAVSKNMGLVQSLISQGRGLAGGGIIHSGKNWIYNGIRYASERAAQNAETRAQRAAKKPAFDTSTLSGLTSAATGAQSNPIVDAMKAIIASAKTAGKSLNALVKTRGGDSTGIPLIEFLHEQTQQLVKLTKQREQVAARLQKAQQKLADLKSASKDMAGSVHNAVTGSFDITSLTGTTTTTASKYGDVAPTTVNHPLTAGSIVKQIAAAALKARRFGALIRKLGKEGLNKVMLSQLAQAGPAAYDQAKALEAATPKQLASINSSYRTLATTGASLGNYVAKDYYGAGIKSAQGLVAGLKSQQSALNAAIRAIARSMIKQLKKTLGIHSPSAVMRYHGQMTGEGFRLGMLDKASGISAASGAYGNAAVPSSQWSSSGGGDTHYHVHGIEDPAGFIAAVDRRRYMAGKF